MIAVILAIIGLIFLIVGFVTHLWILFLLAAIFFIICAIIIYVKSKRERPAFSKSGEEIIIESSVNYSRQSTVDTGSTQKLHRLTELRNAGILTDEEYEQKKSEIERETAPAEEPVPETVTAEKTVSEAAPAEKPVPEAVPAEKPVADTDSDQKLKKLAELRDDGILTDEEYEQKKSQILQETAPAKKTEPDAATIEKINKLAELRDEGILTDEEYEQKKAKLLEDSA
jgi:cytochrome c-type biogenesis protein CcmH/NrfG